MLTYVKLVHLVSFMNGSPAVQRYQTCSESPADPHLPVLQVKHEMAAINPSILLLCAWKQGKRN